MDKWEYMIVDSKDMVPPGISRRSKEFSEVEQYLNALGAEGWEIINLDLRLNGWVHEEYLFTFTGVAKRAKRS